MINTLDMKISDLNTFVVKLIEKANKHGYLNNFNTFRNVIINLNNILNQ